jgi:hypothetical protein
VSGRVESIHVVAERFGTPERRDRVTVVAGSGIEGDTHFDRGHDLTLIEAEAIDGLASQKLTGEPGVLRGLVHRGGLCAEVVSGGQIAVGDPVEPC